MFEHCRNYQRLLSNCAGWLNPRGLLFIHVFSHHRFAYPFELRDSSDWMAQHFFTGGIMPGDSLLLYFQDDMRVTGQWRLNGKHYQRTAECGLNNMDVQRGKIVALFERV